MATDDQGRPRPVFPGVQTIPRVTTDGVWVAVPTESELRRTDWSGALDRVVRFEGSERALGTVDVERIHAWYRDATSGLPAEARAMMAEPAVLPRMPAFGRMLTDPHQNLWVQEVRDDRDPRDWEFGAPRGSTRWRVMDPEGLWLGTLDLPDGFQLHSVGDDHLLGVWKDAAGVEFIHLYRLVRS